MSDIFTGIRRENFANFEEFLEALYGEVSAAIEYKLMSELDMDVRTEALYFSKYDSGFGDRFTLDDDSTFCLGFSHISGPDEDEEEED